ncbi:hypothetical protein ABZ914_14440 [Spirillospora sp. NPDC046719]
MMLLGSAPHTAVEEWDRMVSLNVAALLHITHAAVPHLIYAASTSPRQVADLVNVGAAAGRSAWWSQAPPWTPSWWTTSTRSRARSTSRAHRWSGGRPLGSLGRPAPRWPPRPGSLTDATRARPRRQ